MITLDFIWLILSHLTVFFPIYIGLKENFRRWLPICITLITTAFFSSIYHWVDQDKFKKDDFIFLGNNHQVYTHMDFFCSYLTIFLTVFYTINPTLKPKYIDISLILIVLISAFVSFINCEWYSFIIIVTIFSLIYIFKCKNFNFKDLLINIYHNKILSFFGISSLIAAIVMQYYFAIRSNKKNYRIYHGFWHFFMFFSCGMWMLWNEKYRRSEKIKILCIPV